MMPRCIDLKGLAAYEVGAILMTELVYPGPGFNDAIKEGFHRSLCSLHIRHQCAIGGVVSHVPQTSRSFYVLQDERTLRRDFGILLRRLRDRMAAGYMAIPFFQKALKGDTPLHPGVKRLSLNEMANYVLESCSQSYPVNVKSRIWASSRQIIHLCAAIQMLLQHGRTPSDETPGFDHFMSDPETIARVVLMAQEYEELVPKTRLRISPDELVQVRLA